MRSKLLISTAAALVLGVGLAAAQGPGGQGAKPESGASPSGGAGMSQGAQPGSAGKSNQGGAGNLSQGAQQGGGAKPNAAERAQTSPSGEKSNKAGSTAQSDSNRSPSSQSQSRDQGMKGNQRAQDNAPTKGAQGAAQQQGMERNQSGQQSGAGKAGATGQAGAAGQAGTSSSSTTQANTGAAAGSNVTLNAEQKTKIRETVINASNAPRVTNVNFALSVGTVVPTSVRFAPVPAALVEINPGWRSYQYFIVSEEIIIVDPRTHRIIAVLPV